MTAAVKISRRSLLGFRPELRPVTAPPASAAPAPDALAVVSSDCIELSGIVCRACDGVCPASAISFTPRLGGCANVTIAAALCTGCTDCLRRCPVGAIAMHPRTLPREVIQ